MTSASDRFQDLVDRCLEDGKITDIEAALLVDQHNQLQKASREALRKILMEHGKYDTRGRMSKNLTPAVQKLDIDHNKDTIKDKIMSPLGDEKVRFAVITVPAALVSLLGFIGVL